MRNETEKMYASPKAAIENTDNEPSYAGFWVRFLASFIDAVWQMSLVFALGYLVYGATYLNSEEFFQGPFDVFLQFGLPMLVVLAFWFYKSATPGKQILGLKIVNASDYGIPTKAQFFKRYFGYYVSMIPLCLGYFWVAFDSKKRGFHDMLSGTVVIYVRSNKSRHS